AAFPCEVVSLNIVVLLRAEGDDVRINDLRGDNLTVGASRLSIAYGSLTLKREEHFHHQRVVALPENTGINVRIASSFISVHFVEVQNEVNSIAISGNVDDLKFSSDDVRRDYRIRPHTQENHKNLF